MQHEGRWMDGGSREGGEAKDGRTTTLGMLHWKGRGRDAYEDNTSVPPLPREDARTPRVRKSTCFVQGEEHVVKETRGRRSTWTLHVHGSFSCEVVSFTHGL